MVKQIETAVEQARVHEEWKVEYMTLYLRDQENREIGREEGREEGLRALVQSLRVFIQEEELLYQAIIKNDTYKDISRDTLKKYL